MLFLLLVNNLNHIRIHLTTFKSLSDVINQLYIFAKVSIT